MTTFQTNHLSRSFRRLAIAALALGASFVGPSVASAGTSVVDFTSSTNVKGLGSFAGTATLDNRTNLLTIVMNNTSSKGYLYGFAFDLSGAEKAKDITKDKHGFKSIGKHGITVKPFGKYQAGAMDSGSNRRAISAEKSKTLVFSVSGLPSGTTAFDLLNNPKGESIVALFRGFHHGVRDRAGAAVVIPIGPSEILGVSSGPTGIVTTTTGPTIGTKTGGTSGGTIDTGPSGGGTTVAAVPLPSSAYSGIGMLALVAGAMLKRKVTRALA